MGVIYQHLDKFTPRTHNRQNWICAEAGIFFGFDVTTNIANKTISVGHNDTGLIRPDPNGTGGLVNEPIQGGGVTYTGATFFTDSIFNLTIADNTSGSTRTDLLALFFVEKDLRPYIEPSLVILQGVSSTTDKRYLPIATLTVPNNFTNSKAVTVTKFKYNDIRNAAMTHIANDFLEQNTFSKVVNSEGNLFEATPATFSNLGVLTIDINKSFHTVGNTLTGVRGLKNIVVTNTDNITTTGKHRIFHVQFNLNWCLYNVGNIATSRTYTLTEMSVVTFLYDIDSDIFWVVGVTNPRHFKSGSDVTVDANKLIVAPALDELYYVDATTTPEITGISLINLNGVTKAELGELVGYEFKLVFVNCSHTNKVVINNTMTAAVDRIKFKEKTTILTPCVVECLVGEDGDILYNVNLGEMFDDVTASAIFSYPSPSIQPNVTDPIKVYKTGINKYLVCGVMNLTSALAINDAVVIINLANGYRPKVTSNYAALIISNVTSMSTNSIRVDANNMQVILHINKAQSASSVLYVYFEYIRQ